MRKLLAFSVCAALLLSGCPKKGPSNNVAGSDDEQMDQLTAKLEELRSRAKAEEVKCPEWCTLARQVCDLSKQTCDITARNPDRMEMQQKCAQSQEDCTTFNDGCAKCG